MQPNSREPRSSPLGDSSVLVRTLWEARRRILLTGAVAALVAGAGSFLVPQTYESETTILPVPSNDGLYAFEGAMAAASLIRSLKGDAASSQTELLAEILQSRTVLERTIESLDLVSAFELSDEAPPVRVEKALERLSELTDVSLSRGGLITLRVRAKSGLLTFHDDEAAARARSLAESIAAHMTQHLDDVVHETSTSRARSSRVFIQEELEDTRQAMRVASDSLREFQTSNVAVSLDEQTREMVSNLADIQARIAIKEVSLDVARKTMTADNPQIVRLETELEALRVQYGKYLTPSANGKSEANGEFLIPLLALPAMAQEYADLVRTLKVQETVFRLLNELYYQARIEEARDIPTVQVLDHPRASYHRVAPRGALLVLGAFLLGGMATSTWVVGREGWRRAWT